MRDRKVLTMNEDEVLKEAERRAVELFERTGICSKPETYWPLL